jgi:hypothetical protein
MSLFIYLFILSIYYLSARALPCDWPMDEVEVQVAQAQILQTFKEHLGNMKGTVKGNMKGNIQGTLNAHEGEYEGKHSGNIQRTFRKHPVDEAEIPRNGCGRPKMTSESNEIKGK